MPPKNLKPPARVPAAEGDILRRTYIMVQDYSDDDVVQAFTDIQGTVPDGGVDEARRSF